MHDYTKYFKNNLGFTRLLTKIYQKYQSLSKFTGSISLSNLTKEESITLSRFFGNNYQEGANIKVPLKKFISIMESSKYEDFDLGTLIEEYFNTKLITNKESKLKSEEDEINYYNEILTKNDSLGTTWLKTIITTKIPPYKLIHARYTQNKNNLKKDLINIINLIDNLPKEKTLLPIYASNYTKDPHYLDLDTKNSNLFFYALSYITKSNYPITRADKIKLLSDYNIEIDTISNYVVTYNLNSNKDYINSFSKNKETLILNIQNILNTTFDTTTKKVFIFENPSILTEIISRNINASIIISGGFPNTSVYLLIDSLISTGNHIYYNGDFDPEGLIIAKNLKDKYQDNLTLFCYHKEDYHNCLSNKEISLKRLHKLQKITNIDLLEIKELLLKTKLSAYQENNKERIIEFLNSKL